MGCNCNKLAANGAQQQRKPDRAAAPTLEDDYTIDLKCEAENTDGEVFHADDTDADTVDVSVTSATAGGTSVGRAWKQRQFTVEDLAVGMENYCEVHSVLDSLNKMKTAWKSWSMNDVDVDSPEVIVKQTLLRNLALA